MGEYGGACGSIHVISQLHSPESPKTVSRFCLSMQRVLSVGEEWAESVSSVYEECVDTEQCKTITTVRSMEPLYEVITNRFVMPFITQI